LRLAGAAPTGWFAARLHGCCKGKALRPLWFACGFGGNVQRAFAHRTQSRAAVPECVIGPALVANCDVQANFALEDFVLEAAVPKFKLHLACGLAMLSSQARLFTTARSGLGLGIATADDALCWLTRRLPTRYRTRNFEARAGSAGASAEVQFYRAGCARGFIHLKGQNAVLNCFSRASMRVWKRNGIVTLEERLERSTQQNLERIEPRFQIRATGEQWFDLSVAYDTKGGERFAAADIQRLLLSGQSHTRLQSGKFALLDTGAVEELQEVLLDCSPQQHAEGYRLNNAKAGVSRCDVAATAWLASASADGLDPTRGAATWGSETRCAAIG